MPDEHVTQRLALTIRNNLSAGNITIMNSLFYSGQSYQERDTLQIISPEDVNHISIRPGGSDVMSFCGSAAFKLGIEGMLDLMPRWRNSHCLHLLAWTMGTLWESISRTQYQQPTV
ncbi:uncharacterized protein N7459_003244 [Penicillium hispanicum]|uniref:uncharacterized protein n=1 Tax=Penicillium hispanicum TaxID=1080232 RepID=UPI0025403607|nr:uncharacterized protein N7459_003244 [Penicillium hispanicum]KAJ5587479.1 hypothetical protein N7459_003244 [Penicillium hispanicum]